MNNSGSFNTKQYKYIFEIDIIDFLSFTFMTYIIEQNGWSLQLIREGKIISNYETTYSTSVRNFLKIIRCFNACDIYKQGSTEHPEYDTLFKLK